MSEHMFGGPDEVMEHLVSITTVTDDMRLGRLQLLAHLDESGAYNADGFTSASSFLVARCGMGPGEANREVFLARSLKEMPYSTKLVVARRLTVNQLEVLARVRSRHPDEFTAEEHTLAESVSGLDLNDTRRAVDYWCQAHCEPDDVEPDTASRVFLSRTLDGRGRLDGDLDPETHSLLSAALGTLMDELVASTPKSELPTLSEVRAEALSEMARRHLDSDSAPVDHGNRPHLTVVADWKTLTGADRGGLSELLDETVISPETLQRLACDAITCRLLTGPDSEVLDLGRNRRTVSPAQWRALRVRDRHCRFPGCRRPWSWCDAHHIEHWALHDGPSDLCNLCLLCRHHHTLVHEGGWTIQGTGEDPIFIRPDGRVLATGPP
jgi:hypothetical protein